MFNDIIWNQNIILDAVIQKHGNVRYIKESEEYEVTLWIVWKKDMPVIYEKEVVGAEKIVAVFDRMNHDMWSYFEKNILDVIQGDNEKDISTVYNFMKMRAFIVRWLLKKWSLPIELNKMNNGELTDDCFKRVMKVHPRIMGNLISCMEEHIFIQEKEKETILKQASLLFMPNSPGVTNAHEAISLYCSLSSFWDKFGLNYFDLQKLPENVLAQLKMVINAEGDVRTQQQKKSNHKRGKVTFGKNRRPAQSTQVA